MTEINATLKASPLTNVSKPKRSWGKSFDGSSGFVIKLPNNHWMAFFVDKRLAQGDSASRSAFLDSYKVIADSITELGRGWTVYAEPLGLGRMGISIHAATGKVIAAGSGKIIPAGGFNFKASTLFGGISNGGSPTTISAKKASKPEPTWTFTFSGKADSNGGVELSGSASYSK